MTVHIVSRVADKIMAVAITAERTAAGSDHSRVEQVRFARYAIAVLLANLMVVLWGAYVRATGSGAGCGSHWPLCNGEVVPRAPAIATVIEFTHRLSSGVALISVAALWLWSIRLFPRGSRVRTAALLSLVFILVEALLGAGLVLLRYVAENASLGRAIYLSAHLVNTQILLACLTITAWRAGSSWEGPLFTRRNAMVQGALACVVLVSISGAIAALGDTLFPSTSFAEGLRQEVSSASHILLRLRILHPALAAATGILLILAAVPATRNTTLRVRRQALLVLYLLLLQLAAGAVNVLMLAPVPMQLFHLLLADLLWISLVGLMIETARPRANLVAE